MARSAIVANALDVVLCRWREPKDLEVVPALDEHVYDVDVVAAKGLDLGDRPHDLLDVRCKQDLPGNGLDADPAMYYMSIDSARSTKTIVTFLEVNVTLYCMQLDNPWDVIGVLQIASFRLLS
mgnify:FL=1